MRMLRLSQDQDSPLVSMLIGTRDRYRPLLRCLHSVLNQNYSKLEILVLDDCSQEHSIYNTIAEEINDPRVKCFRSERQLGVAGGRNFLMRKAQGDILCVIDDDAYFGDQDCLSRIVQTFEHNLDVGILAFKVIDHRKGREDLLVPFSRWWRRRQPHLTEEPQLVSYYLGGCHAIRRSAFEQCGGYQDNLIFGEEELDLSYRVIESGFKIMYVPNIVVHHCPQPSVVGSRGRRSKSELYYHVRNRLFLAYKYLPWPYLLSYLAVWLCFYGLTAIRSFAFKELFTGLIDGIREIKNQKRTPLNRDSVRYLKAHYGRLWY